MTTISGSTGDAGVLATLSVRDKGETISVALSGTYSMVINLEREKGSPGSGAWEILKTWSTANATVAYSFKTTQFNERFRLNVATDTSGTVVYSYSDGDKLIYVDRDPTGVPLATRYQSGLVEHGDHTVEGDASVEGTLTLDDVIVNDVGAGAKNGATVVAVEYGDGVVHKTVLTCTATPLTFGDEAGQGQYGGVKVYDFPTGAVNVLGAVINGAVTLTAPAIDTWNGDIGLGVAAPTDHQDATNKTGSVLQKTSTTQAVAKVATTDAKSAATALTESGARWLDGTGTAIDLFLNLLIDDDAAHDNTITGTFTGTITIVWVNLGTTA